MNCFLMIMCLKIVLHKKFKKNLTLVIFMLIFSHTRPDMRTRGISIPKFSLNFILLASMHIKFFACYFMLLVFYIFNEKSIFHYFFIVFNIDSPKTSIKYFYSTISYNPSIFTLFIINKNNFNFHGGQSRFNEFTQLQH